MLYKKIIRPILFLFDAETIHDFTGNLLSIANKSRTVNNLIFRCLNYTSPRLKQKKYNLYFRTPVGLAGGMDKKAAAPLLWSAFDFGWAELGSFTYEAHGGNARPRLWRMIPEQGIIVYSGLPNKGAVYIAEKLYQEKNRYPKRGLWGISLAKTPRVPMEQAADDYAKSFQLLEPLADIITINLSCPNIPGFIGLQNPTTLEPILDKITSLNKNKKPIWLKIGNDLGPAELDPIISLVKKYHISAIIAANLSKDRTRLNIPAKYQDKPGGVSGKLIQERANQIIAYLYQKSDGQYDVIGCGGIFTGADAFAKIKAGASLLQVATGFIFGGPTAIKHINKDLDLLLINNGYQHISAAVGVEANKYQL